MVAQEASSAERGFYLVQGASSENSTVSDGRQNSNGPILQNGELNVDIVQDELASPRSITFLDKDDYLVPCREVALSKE